MADAITMDFGQRVLFRQLSVSIQEGESVAVMGPSGAGKSTLLGILSGLISPSAGRVYAIDATGELSGSVASMCAWVPQGSNVLGARRTLDNAMLGSLGRGRTRSEARAEALTSLRRVALVDAAHKPASVLSGGELQRLAIARALCQARPVLFADEPTGSLDAENTRLVSDLFRAIAGEGVSVVVATHDPEVARRCDRIVSLDQ